MICRTINSCYVNILCLTPDTPDFEKMKWILAVIAFAFAVSGVPTEPEVEPSNMLGIGPFPCEKRCAHVRNNLVRAIDKNDYSIAEYAYRYIQARSSERIEILKAAGAGLVPVIGWAALFPITKNARRYHKTKLMALAELEKRGMTPDFLKRLKRVKYTRDGRYLIDFFNKEGRFYEASVLEADRLNSMRTKPSSCKKCNNAQRQKMCGKCQANGACPYRPGQITTVKTEKFAYLARTAPPPCNVYEFCPPPQYRVDQEYPMPDTRSINNGPPPPGYPATSSNYGNYGPPPPGYPTAGQYYNPPPTAPPVPDYQAQQDNQLQNNMNKWCACFACLWCCDCCADWVNVCIGCGECIDCCCQAVLD